MAKPSLAASQIGIQLAKQSMTKAGWTQKRLSTLVDCSRQPITNFFKGEPVAQPIFVKICDRLNLNWQEIADFSALTPTVSTITNVSLESFDHDPIALVQNLRRQTYAALEERCGTMRILDMSYPIGIEDIYTDVNILEQLSGRRRKKLDDLLESCDVETFDRLGFGQATEERISGIEAVQKYRRLIILGKPGAGKTTFLKHLAIQCNEGKFESERLPIFVTLKDFAETPDQPELLQYICHRDFHDDPEASQAIAAIFQQGRALVLLDGLDEVRGEDHDRIVRDIRTFSEQYYDNHFVITCRIAAWEYTFEKFTEVEIADFDEVQIAAFVAKWFSQKPIKPESFLRALNQNPKIYQLAVSPLLLTLLCLAFEESGEFPASRSELYKEGIDALLKKWDAKRGIQRDQVYKKLSLQHKQDLLSYIALVTFKQQSYFFKQSVLEEYIADYIADLPDAQSDPEALKLDSEAVLRSIEAQHGLLVERAKGIYSFSHLTFQEYFAAREIVFNAAHLDEAIHNLLNHLHDRRWQEIFLLTTEMLRDASRLILPMKQAIDGLLAHEAKLQRFLHYVHDRATSPEFSFCKPLAARAFCFDIDFDIDKRRAIALLADPTAKILVCASFFTRILNISLEQAIAIAQDYEASAPSDQKITATHSADEAMWIGVRVALQSEKIKPDLHRRLKEFTQRENLILQDDKALEQMADDARKVAKDNLNHIGNDAWKLSNRQFTDNEKNLLRQYYKANELLLRCLKSEGCRMDRKTRQHVEETLLMPN
ncbi:MULTISPECIES: NACHT domain-containing NTPase [unclassified Leptolyngbya]|uniref:NACHT domain-containing protein n=1 Tax=unclassified Leptolyngbya TaxID=2650499 RepID=UPI0016858026|nr:MULTISPECIES: NACHT domain-containing NTPase [unclassified Leptolyngbya]MBD1913168.1 NACHT domain-containing NTPase [Leptolyngbya sp. FACHB-8]MBD2158793.1 NACHT domain-containing NTPase [Leptolyngbya sp. FACHB-16]